MVNLFNIADCGSLQRVIRILTDRAASARKLYWKAEKVLPGGKTTR